MDYHATKRLFDRLCLILGRHGRWEQVDLLSKWHNWYERMCRSY